MDTGNSIENFWILFYFIFLFFAKESKNVPVLLRCVLQCVSLHWGMIGQVLCNAAGKGRALGLFLRSPKGKHTAKLVFTASRG